MPKIILADAFNLSKEARGELAAAAELICFDLGDRSGLLGSVGDADVIVAEYARIDREVIDAAPRLKGIVVYGTGKDHIDLEAAAERKIEVASTAGANADAVAELTFALLLNCVRRVHEADRYIREGLWREADSAGVPAAFHGTELKGKSVGLIGYGNIGRRIAHLAQAFGMTPYYWKPRISNHRSEAYYRPLADMLSFVDILSVNCPLKPETRGLLSRERLISTKKGLVLIVASRGNIVDEKALADLLTSGHIAAAGLDVFSSEPLSADSPLLNAPNVMLTPHIGGSTREAEINISRAIVLACRKMLRL